MPPPSQLEIEELIRDFQRFLAPTLPQLKIERGVDCVDDYRKISTALGKCGVYLIFDDSESLRYIGVTGCLAERIPAYRYEDRFVPRWVDVIPFDSESKYLALALEWYLLDKVSRIKDNVLVNKRGTFWRHFSLDIDDI